MMEIAVVIVVVVGAAGWFIYRLYRAAAADEPACNGACGHGCGKDPLSEYRKEREKRALQEKHPFSTVETAESKTACLELINTEGANK